MDFRVRGFQRSIYGRVLLFILTVFVSQIFAVTYKPLTPKDTSDESIYFHNYGTEQISENQVLPEDLEITIFIRQNKNRRLIFLLDMESQPLSLTVTPCGCEIEWHLLRRNFLTFHDDDKPLYNQVTNTGEISAIQASYKTKERRTFYQKDMPIGLYILELATSCGETSLRVHLTTKKKGTNPYPVIPEEEKIRVSKIRRDSVMVSWRSTPQSKNHKNNTEYCVVVNTESNFNTMCEVKGETKRDYFETDTGYQKFKLSSLSSQYASKSPSPLVCIGQLTWHLFRNLKPRTKYFFDVFVINRASNISSKYRGTFATTLGKREDQNLLKYNSMTTINLNRSNAFSSSLKFNIQKIQPKTFLFLQSCSGPGPIRVEIANGPKTVLRSQVMELKSFEIKDLSNGSYTLTVSSSVQTFRTARILISRKYHRFPFPSLPEDKIIRVLDTYTTCESVTLAWKPTENEKVRYCLYRNVTALDNDNVFDNKQNSCENELVVGNNRRKILCRRYHRFSKLRFTNVIKQQVKGLRPSETYIFDVYVTKLRGKALAYDSVWVTTREKCSGQSTVAL